MINARVLAELEAQNAWIAGLVDGHTKELAARWQQAWNSLIQQLEASLTRLASDHPTVSAQVRAIRAEKAWQAVADQLTQLAIQAGADSSQLAALLAQQAGLHQQALIAAQLPPNALSLQLVRDDPQATAWITDRATQQITARHFFLQAEAAEQMKQALIASAALGHNPRETARQMVRAVQGVFNGGLTRALVIARTEQIDAYRASAEAAQNANKDVLAGWQWVAALSDRTCRSCLAQHGSIHPLDEPGPQDHQQGRCSRAPVTKTWAELGLKGIAEPPGRVQPGDGEKWLRGQPAEVQDKILGKAGAEAWRDGGWPSSQWSQLRRTDGWRDSYGAAKYEPPPTMAGWRSTLTGPSAMVRGTETAIAAIDQLHGIPNGVRFESMTPADLARKPPGTQGFYSPSNPGVVKVNTTSDASFPALSTAHEFGHLLDREYLGHSGIDASELSIAPEWLAWRQAIQSSTTGQDLAARAAAGDLWASYAIKDSEVWGRSYAQWVAVRTQNRALLNDLRERQRVEDGFIGTWADVDFDPVAEAIDAIIQLLKEAW